MKIPNDVKLVSAIADLVLTKYRFPTDGKLEKRHDKDDLFIFRVTCVDNYVDTVSMERFNGDDGSYAISPYDAKMYESDRTFGEVFEFNKDDHQKTSEVQWVRYYGDWNSFRIAITMVIEHTIEVHRRKLLKGAKTYLTLVDNLNYTK